MKKLLVVITFALVTATAHAKTYTVERVVSGDIIKLTNGKIVRLLGIDTPESEYDVEATGLNLETIKRNDQRAKQYLENIINQIPERKVNLEFDIEKKNKFSKSGRWQAYVFWNTDYSEDELVEQSVENIQHFDYFNGKHKHFINATMVKAGYAIPMSFEPNVKYKALFEQLHELAKGQKRGLWGGSKPLNEVITKEPLNKKEPEKTKLIEIARQPVDVVDKQLFAEDVILPAVKPVREKKEFYDNGELKLHMALFNEENFEGFWREYYQTGALKVDVKLLKVEGGCSDAGEIPIEGVAREFHINGQLKQHGKYENNCEEGVHKHYSYEGVLEEKLYFERGRHLWTKRYDEFGQIASEDRYDDAIINKIPNKE